MNGVASQSGRGTRVARHFPREWQRIDGLQCDAPAWRTFWMHHAYAYKETAYRAMPARYAALRGCARTGAISAA
ncbi:hypothetical protein F01_420156 [Burkholderia cenocepacia]|nr:hypothetical protein F01_420156 [Burkholderia cenocepacia]